MKKSGLLARQEFNTQWMMDVSGDVNRQMMMDCLCMLLHDAEAMEGRTWGPEKIQRFADRLVNTFDEYFESLTRSPEADYYQEKLDRQLRPIFGDKFLPFVKRYPDIKEITYGLRKRH